MIIQLKDKILQHRCVNEISLPDTPHPSEEPTEATRSSLKNEKATRIVVTDYESEEAKYRIDHIDGIEEKTTTTTTTMTTIQTSEIKAQIQIETQAQAQAQVQKHKHKNKHKPKQRQESGPLLKNKGRKSNGYDYGDFDIEFESDWKWLGYSTKTSSFSHVLPYHSAPQLLPFAQLRNPKLFPIPNIGSALSSF
ncbi:hypothetical protein RFI_33390, partial [Reticulomyxa filosa]